jgi:hypothetical protein
MGLVAGWRHQSEQVSKCSDCEGNGDNGEKGEIQDAILMALAVRVRAFPFREPRKAI